MTDAQNMRKLKVRSIDGNTFEIEVSKDVSSGSANILLRDNYIASLSNKNILDSCQRSQKNLGGKIVGPLR
jgi:hypothetical protein